jgi:hypothetical protein
MYMCTVLLPPGGYPIAVKYIIYQLNCFFADSDDDDSIPDLHERLRDVNLDDADSVWEKLTPAERQKFEEMLQSGDVSQLAVPWEPWWLYRSDQSACGSMGTMVALQVRSVSLWCYGNHGGSTGQISQLVVPWEPWWLYRSD